MGRPNRDIGGARRKRDGLSSASSESSQGTPGARQPNEDSMAAMTLLVVFFVVGSRL